MGKLAFPGPRDRSEEHIAKGRDSRPLVWLVALACSLAVLLVKWVNFPLTNQLRGVRFSFLGYATGGPGSRFLSYGALAAVLFIAAAFSVERRKTKALAALGSALVVVAFAALMQVALVDSELFKNLADETGQLQWAMLFSQRYLLANLGNEPSIWLQLSLETVWSRLITGWGYLGFGWYLALTGGIVIVSYALACLASARERLFFAGVLAAALVALVSICLLPYSLSERALDRAIAAESAGRPEEAIRQYRRAIRLYGWNRVNLDLYARIGAIDSSLGRTSTLEYGVYRAELEASESDFPSAIAHFEELAGRATAIAPVLRRRAAGLLANYGAGLYQEAAFGAAVDAWRHALKCDPTMWIAAYYLTRGCFAAGCYQESVDLSKELLKQLGDPILSANLYSNLGDAYTKLGKFDDAHRAYRYAWYIDYRLDFRSVSALVGP